MLKRKDVPQSISGRDDLHKHDLHNVVAVTEAQASLRQRRTQVEGERRRTIGFECAGPCLFIAREGKGGQQRRLRVNWRDHRNISSFYFTRFPEDTTEDELWKIFRRAGDVREVFIPNKRNRTGRRYGFVRFIGVDNVQQLERRLDNIVMGGLKLYVNIPKFERGRGRVQPQSTGGRDHTRHVEQGRRETYQAQKHTAMPGQIRGSFADVVAKKEKAKK